MQNSFKSPTSETYESLLKEFPNLTSTVFELCEALETLEIQGEIQKEFYPCVTLEILSQVSRKQVHGGKRAVLDWTRIYLASMVRKRQRVNLVGQILKTHGSHSGRSELFSKPG